MPIKPPVSHSDPEILGGTPVFVGTRVPVQSLFDYLEGGDTLNEYLKQFPQCDASKLSRLSSFFPDVQLDRNGIGKKGFKRKRYVH
jgi:uncharacterized protein (DUF433 family)